MKRRNFLKNTGTALLGLPLTLNGMSITASALSPSFMSTIESDKILILIKLSGGNDGLNTIIPLDQYANLTTHRGDIILPSSSVLNLTPETGIHPAMNGLWDMWNQGELAVVQGVGYPNFNRSHFRATDITDSASDAETVLNSGWLGRYFDGDHPDYPDNYPNNSYPAPFAITIGKTVSKTCQGLAHNFSLAMEDPYNLNPLASGLGGSVDPGYYKDRLDYIRSTLDQTNQYSSVIQTAANMGTSSGSYPGTTLGEQLSTVAKLISGGLQTNVYVITQGGYDTHGSQVDVSDRTSGKHADILSDLSQAIAAFQSDMNTQGLQDKVIGLAYTEFGRRIINNGSRGTDHGDAGPMILFGSQVTPGVFGSNPSIPTTVSNSQGVSMQFDFKDVYRTILDSWFCAGEMNIQNNILYGSYSDLGATGGPCSSILPIELLSFEAQSFKEHIGLMWEIGEAETLDGFWLQRSEDGIAFNDYKYVEGYSNVKVYHFDDQNVRVNHQYYYRLKQVEVDENTSFSLIRSAIIKKNEEDYMTVFPNPANHYITIKTNQDFYNDSQLLICDKSGKPVYESHWNGQEQRIEVGHLAVGMYSVQVFTNYRSMVKKFLKVK